MNQDPAIAIDDPDIPVDDPDIPVDAADPLGGALDGPVTDVATGADAGDPTIAPAVSATPAPVAAPLAELLPADFPLPTLFKYVPKVELKAALDQAVHYANGLQIINGGPGAIAKGDAAVTAVKDAVKAIEADFEEPARLLDQAHKCVTKKRAEWIADGVATAKLVGRRVADETLRLEEEARREAQRQQEEANRQAREAAAREVEVAQQAGAPAGVVEQLQEAVETAVAPPVYVPPAAPKSNTVTKTWKARIKGTPETAPANPKMAELTAPQRNQVMVLLKGILEGRDPITVLDLNWSVINGRAKDDKSAFSLTGFEAYVDTGLRAKPGGRR